MSNNTGTPASQPLILRCLALTGSFETNLLPPGCFGCVAGDFDGQGISYSALQWNIGQGTLQPLLAEMNASHNDVMNRVFGDGMAQLTAMLAMQHPAQLTWARSLQSPMHKLDPSWIARFNALGATAEFQAMATRHASAIFDSALALCRTLGVKSERAAALLFDIKVQNGGITQAAQSLIQVDFNALDASGANAADDATAEVAKLRSIANRVADSANPRWREDVRTRKLAIANGAGIVHGVHFDLAAQFGLSMNPQNPVSSQSQTA